MQMPLAVLCENRLRFISFGIAKHIELRWSLNISFFACEKYRYEQEIRKDKIGAKFLFSSICLGGTPWASYPTRYVGTSANEKKGLNYEEKQLYRNVL